MKTNGLQFAGVSLAAALMFPANALALDARDFADKLSATISLLGAVDISFVDAQATDDTVVLRGWEISGLPEMDGKSFEGTLTFSGVSETENGGYEADTASFEDVDITKDGIRVQVRNVSFSDIEIFADPTDPLNSMRLYKGVEMGPISVDKDGQSIFEIASITSQATITDDNMQYSGDYAVTGIYGDLSLIDEDEFQEVLELVEMDELRASMDGSFFWDLGTGQMDIRESAMTIEGIGRLAVSLDLRGYTLEMYKTMLDMNQDMKGMDPMSEEAQMKSMQMLMGMASKISIGGMSIRFDDDSISDKLLDFFAAEQGMSRKQLVGMAAQMLPAMLAELEIPELQAQITDAVIAYLIEPKSFEISVQPENPVPVIALMSAAQNPSVANDMLNFSVTANQ